jgi:uncharacterized delta-60 repeat protein
MKTPRLSHFRISRMLRISMLLLLLIRASFIAAQSGQNDSTFNEFDNETGQGANLPVKVSALQPDNKILIAGNFTNYNGTTVYGLTRITMDGKLDESFDSGAGTDGVITSINVLLNNKIIVAGGFTTYNGSSYTNIVRLNPDGSFDTTFSSGTGSNDVITQVVLQYNEKMLVVGSFTEYNGVNVRGLVRLNRDGTVDTTFQPETDSLSRIYRVALQSDGKIIVAGLEDSEDPMDNNYALIRLNIDGTRDFSFNKAGLGVGNLYPFVNAIRVESDGNILLSTNIYDSTGSVHYHGILTRLDSQGNTIGLQGLFWINELLIQEDGKIIAVGFDDVNSNHLEKRVIRLNTDLSNDESFVFNDNRIYPERSGVSIETAALQIDGKIVIAGDFYELNGLIVNNIARLNLNGTFDNTFNQHTGFNGSVFATAVDEERRLIVGGDFSRFNYLFRSHIVRLTENGDLDPEFNVGSGTNGPVQTIAVQSNGRILIGGSFTSYNGDTCSNIAGLGGNGSIDTSFGEVTTDGMIRKIIIDTNNRIIIAGDFENVNGVPMRAIARIMEDGTLDNTFTSSIDAYGRGYDCKISSSGNIYLAVIYQDGSYTFGTDIFRLNEDGTRDESFQISTGEFYSIYTLAFNNNNQLIAGGSGQFSDAFQTYPGIVAQFNSDGSFDSTLNYSETESFLNGSVRTIHVLENDKIVIGGEFTANSETSMHHIGLLNSNGEAATEFTGTASNQVFCLSPVINDKLIVGGSFSEYASAVRNGIARIDVSSIEVEPGKNTIIASKAGDMQLLNIYPNPATSALTIENLDPGSTLKIFNTVGKQVYSEMVTMKKATVELEDFSNGMYIIVSEDKGNKATSKFVVSK